MKEYDVKKVGNDWFAYIESFDMCDCGKGVDLSGWYNIQKAVDNIKKKIEKEEGQKR